MFIGLCSASFPRMGRYARLLKVRKEVHARLPLMDFVSMNKSVVEFVRDVQHLSGQAYAALSSELQAR